jgi:hypothetical protein
MTWNEHSKSGFSGEAEPIVASGLQNERLLFFRFRCASVHAAVDLLRDATSVDRTTQGLSPGGASMCSGWSEVPPVRFFILHRLNEDWVEPIQDHWASSLN